MTWLRAFYSRRIVNVNVNVVAAGLIALAITIGVMHLADRWGLIARLQGIAPDFGFDLLGRRFELEGHKFVISGLTFVVDLLADVLVYYGLHWLANHMPAQKCRPQTTVAYADLSFMRDASLVQFERAIISPLLYLVALGLQNTLMHKGVSIEKATAAGFVLGIFTSRLVHTLWMLRQERKALQRLRTSAATTPPPPPQPAPAEMPEPKPRAPEPARRV
ncbi:MAG TPA: hypothetical protein VD997_00970 [Phycisphaerales bacterium]|nr:hypothetical protein [Phycisphaerales bacterium]